MLKRVVSFVLLSVIVFLCMLILKFVGLLKMIGVLVCVGMSVVDNWWMKKLRLLMMWKLMLCRNVIVLFWFELCSVNGCGCVRLIDVSDGMVCVICCLCVSCLVLVCLIFVDVMDVLLLCCVVDFV